MKVLGWWFALLPAVLVVGQTPTVTTLGVMPDQGILNAPVTLTATVSPAAEGKVAFFDGVTILGVAPVRSGSARLITALPAAGKRSLQARYVANLEFASSSSNVVPYAVAARPGYGMYFAPGSGYRAGTKPSSLATGDFNGDGIADLAVSNYSSNDVSVFLGDGRGGFRPAEGSPFAAGSGPIYIAAADLDGDGDADLAIANSTSNDVTVLLGDGRGGFGPAPASPIRLGGFFANPLALAIADVNRDGIADLAVTRGGFADDLLVLSGNGSGGFSASPNRTYGVDDEPQSIVAGDFNQDGSPDFAVASLADSQVSIWLGDGSGGLARTRSRYPVLFPYSVVTGDFDGDGRLDLATGESFGVGLMLGDGTGGFVRTAASPFATGTSNNFAGVYSRLATGDFNGDGNSDLVVATGADFQFDIGSIQSAVLFGDGQGGLLRAPWSPITFDSSSKAVVIADFNGDGRSDLGFANDDVQILLAGGGLTITETRSDRFEVGRVRTISLKVTNETKQAIAGDVKVVGDLPAGLRPVIAGGAGWTCNVQDHRVTCIRTGELDPGAAYPSLDVNVDVTGAACQALPASVLNTVTTAEVSINEVLSYRSRYVPTESIAGCIFVSTEVDDLVVNRTGSYVLRVQTAENAAVPPGYPVRVSLLAAGLLSPTAQGDGWTCSSSGQFLNCGANTIGDKYSPIVVSGTVAAAACPTAIAQAVVIGAGSVQNTAVVSNDLYGCLRIEPLAIDAGLISFNVGALRNFTVTSTDRHTLTLTADTRYLQLDFTSRLNPCASLDSLNFGQSCYYSLGLNSCTEPPNFTMTVRADAGGGRVAEYPLTVRTEPVPDQLSINVTGVANQQVSPAGSYPVAIALTPVPDANRCPQNTIPSLAFDFSPQSPEPSARYFDASFDPATSTLHSGTVAGTITLTAKKGEQVVRPRNGSATVSLTVPKLPGVIQRVALRNQRESSVQVDVTAYSTPREVGDGAKTEVCLEFLAAPGAVLNPGGQFCALKDEIRIWYERTSSYAYGSRFLGSITASFTGDSAAIGGIKVVLKNMMGDSAPYCVDFRSGRERECP